MRSVVLLVLAILAAAGAYLFVFDGEVPNWGPSSRIEARLAEFDRRLLEMKALIGDTSRVGEEQLKEIRSAIAELKDRIDAIDPDTEDELASLGEETLDLRRELEAAKFRLSFIDEKLESFQSQSALMEEKLDRYRAEIEEARKQPAEPKKQ